MRAWPLDTPPQVIYLDPMFPHRDKSSLVSRDARLPPPWSAPTTPPSCWRLPSPKASHRVVVKRPRKAPCVAGPAELCAGGKASRFDIYAGNRSSPDTGPDPGR